MPNKDEEPIGTTILINNGFTDDAIMLHAFAKSLGYKFQPSNGEKYRTCSGNMNTQFQIMITGIRLPHLSHHRTFITTFEIAPEESGYFQYGVIMGIGMMDKLGIDQSRSTKTITKGNDIEIAMVPNGFWTDS